MTASPSTGPKSAAGKQIASKNAIKDGLTARRFLNDEELAEFKQIMSDLIQEYDPETKTELIQIERIATTTTRLKRVVSIEDAKYKLARIEKPEFDIPNRMILNGKLGKPKKSDDQIAEEATLAIEGAAPPIQILEMVHRMQTSLSRQLSREIGELIVMIDRREKRSLTINADAPGSKASVEIKPSDT